MISNGRGRGYSLENLRILARTTVRKSYAEFPAHKQQSGVSGDDPISISPDYGAQEEEIDLISKNDGNAAEYDINELRPPDEQFKNAMQDGISSGDIEAAAEETTKEGIHRLEIEGNENEQEFIPLSQGETPSDLSRHGVIEHNASSGENQTESSISYETTELRSKEFDEVLLRSVNCKEFIPKANLHVNIPYPDNTGSDPMVSSPSTKSPSPMTDNAIEIVEDDSFILDIIKNTIHQLTDSPGDFDCIIDGFTETLANFITKKETMETFVSMLIEQAIAEPNFLYSAVRIASTFDKGKTLESSKDVSFRACLYRRLQGEFKSMKTLLEDKSNESNLSRASGLAMLFADLLCSRKKDNQLNVAFLKATFGTISNILEEPCETMISCLIKILKLTGPTLDEHKSQQNLTEVDEIFNRIRDLTLDPRWLSNMNRGGELKQQLFRVYKLHTRNWDRESTEKVESKAAPVHDKDFDDAWPIDWSEYYVGDEELSESDEMDDAFEAFLRESGQI